ncbi:uncharacterized protein LOC144827513 [Lissotriton helveticus]
MEEFGGLAFDEEDLNTILNDNPSILDDLPSTSTPTTEDDWVKLLNLKKNHSRISLHGVIMNEYLHGKCAPSGLIVTTAPRLFLTDKEFVRNWALIAWRCTRDWLILIIKTAKKTADALLIEIQVLEGQINAAIRPVIYKKNLDEANKTNKEYRDNILLNKVEKFKKDLARFSMESAYPYLSDTYVAPTTNSKGRRYGSNYSSSGSDSGSSDQGNPNAGPNFSTRGRGFQRRANRGRGAQQYPNPGQWWPPGPWNYHQGPMGPPPMGHPMPMYPPNPAFYYDQSFLWQGRGRNRGKRRGQQTVNWAPQTGSVTGPTSGTATS